MGTMINGVAVENSDLLSREQILWCIEEAERKAGVGIARIKLTKGPDGQIRADYVTFQRKFERIRRITGYLVGTIDRWNNAKKAEEHERVKHA